jgi:hypothetical protein
MVNDTMNIRASWQSANWITDFTHPSAAQLCWAGDTNPPALRAVASVTHAFPEF